MIKRLLTIISLLTWSFTLYAVQSDVSNIKQESETRWQKIVALKNSSQTKLLAEEADVQMEWFSSHNEWDNYYRTWQLKANALSAQGKLQTSLQETQRMLNDAQKRNNKLGRAMAYKQIGVIYLNMKQTEPAVEALKHYAELMKDEDDFNSISNIYYRIAKAYDYNKQYQQELQETNEWLHFLHTKVGKVKKPQVRECYNSCYLTRAAAFIGLNKLHDAKMALDTANHHAHLTNTSLSLHHYYKMQARYHLAAGDAAKAFLYTDSVKFITTEKDNHTDEIRAQALMLLGRGNDAAQIYQRMYHEKDSVFSHEARQHLDELNTLFQVDELKEEQQRSKFRYTMLASITIVVALLILMLFGWYTVIRLKRINGKLRIANEKAEVSSKMKSEFIRNISHEIRTPLNIVSGFTQVLTSPEIDLTKNEKKDIYERVSENTDRITKLIDRMLMISNIHSDVKIERNDQTDIQTIVALAISHSGIEQYTRPTNIEAHVTFKILIDDAINALTVQTHKLHASRILAQMMENAVKFTHEGTITLQAKVVDGIVRFIVQDTGIGIPADQTERIFEEFIQMDDFADGTGIGLTIARSVAQQMGGNLWIDTNYKQGARFIFELLRY